MPNVPAWATYVRRRTFWRTCLPPEPVGIRSEHRTRQGKTTEASPRRIAAFARGACPPQRRPKCAMDAATPSPGRKECHGSERPPARPTRLPRASIGRPEETPQRSEEAPRKRRLSAREGELAGRVTRRPLADPSVTLLVRLSAHHENVPSGTNPHHLGLDGR